MGQTSGQKRITIKPTSGPISRRLNGTIFPEAKSCVVSMFRTVEPPPSLSGEAITTPKERALQHAIGTQKPPNITEGREPSQNHHRWTHGASECQRMCRGQFDVDNSIPPRSLERLIGTRVQLLQVGARNAWSSRHE